MKELILQLQTKLAELKALQVADPTINVAFAQAELDQLIKIEAFAKPRIQALAAHEAKKQEKQTPKKETPVGLPDPHAVKTKETPKTETPVGLPDPQAVKAAETEKEDTDLEDFLKPEEEDEENVKIALKSQDHQKISKTLEKNATKLATQESAEKHIAEKLEKESEKKGLTTYEKKTLEEAKELNKSDHSMSKEDIEAIKKMPSVSISLTENGGKAKIAAGDNAIEGGLKLNDDGSFKSAEGKVTLGDYSLGGDLELNEDGSLKSGKIDVEANGLILGAGKDENGINGKIGGKTKDSNGNEITAVVKVGVDMEKKQAVVGGTYSKETTDGDKTTIEGELVVSKEKVKASFGYTKENEDKETKSEFGLAVDYEKGKALSVLTNIKNKFTILPEKKYAMPFAHFGLGKADLTFKIKADADVAIKAGAKIEYNETKGLDGMAKIYLGAKATLEFAVGLQLTVAAVAKAAVEFVVKTYIEGKAELAFQLNNANSRTLAALHDIKGGLSAGIRLIIGASDSIIKIYESLGGSGSSLEYSFDLGALELIAFTAPSYHKDKGWDPSKWSFGKGKDLIALENKCAIVRDIIDTAVAILQAIVNFIGGVLKAIGQFVAAFVKGIIALGKAAGEYLLSWISPEVARQREQKAANDAAFEKVIQMSVENVKKNPKLVQRLHNVPEAGREAELQKIVREDKMVVKAWKYIFEGATFEQRIQLAEQLSSTINNFKLIVANPNTQLTKVLLFSISFNSSNKEGGTGTFAADAIRFRLYCNGVCVVNDALNKVIVKNGFNQINTSIKIPAQVQLPANTDLKTAKWELAAIFDLEGDIKDVETSRVAIIVTAPPPPSKAEIAATATIPPPAKLNFMGSGAYDITFHSPEQFLSSIMSIDLANNKFFTSAQLSSAEFTVMLKADGKIISSASKKTPLKANVSQSIALPKVLIPTYFSMSNVGATASSKTWEIVVVANNKEIVKRPVNVAFKVGMWGV